MMMLLVIYAFVVQHLKEGCANREGVYSIYPSRKNAHALHLEFIEDVEGYNC